MKRSSLLLVIVLFAVMLTSVENLSYIRYVNSMPQFGSATVRALLPLRTLFTNVPGGFMTNYVNISSQPWVFTTTYPTNVTALSSPWVLANNHFYSLFTYQTQSQRVLNYLLADNSVSHNPSHAALRAVNLLQYNFPLDVFNVSNDAVIVRNLTYGVASEYILVPTGEYQLYWAAAAQLKKRNGGLGNTSDPHLDAGKAYTVWILPSGGFVVQDGVLNASRKRSVIKSMREETAVANDVKNDDKFPQEESVQASEREAGEGVKNVKVPAARQKRSLQK